MQHAWPDLLFLKLKDIGDVISSGNVILQKENKYKLQPSVQSEEQVHNISKTWVQ